MRQSPRTGVTNVTDIRQMSDARSERIVALLIKMYPTKTAESIQADTGIRASTVRQWMSRESAPNFRALFRLMCAYGPELLLVALDNPPAWLDEAARREEQRKLRAGIAALQAKLERA